MTGFGSPEPPSKSDEMGNTCAPALLMKPLPTPPCFGSSMTVSTAGPSLRKQKATKSGQRPAPRADPKSTGHSSPGPAPPASGRGRRSDLILHHTKTIPPGVPAHQQCRGYRFVAPKGASKCPLNQTPTGANCAPGRRWPSQSGSWPHFSQCRSTASALPAWSAKPCR